MTKFRSVLFALAAFGISGFVIIAWLLPSEKRGELVLEVAKSCIQLLLVTLVGVGISELLKDRESRRAKADKETAQVIRIRRAVTKAYLNSKRSRRCLRAEATKIAPGQYSDIALQPYDRHMRAVNDAQLELERLVRELRVTSPAPEWLKEATSSMKSMESYLRNLITEYEDSYGRSESGQSLKLEMLPRLSDFIGPFDGSQFQEMFSHAHDRFLVTLGKPT